MPSAIPARIAASLTVTTALALAAPAHAAGTPPAANTYICLKPGVPVCMEDTTTFVSAERMQSCQFEVKEYVERTMAYLQCLNDESTATGGQLTRNVEMFNCRLSGGRSCE